MKLEGNKKVREADEDSDWIFSRHASSSIRRCGKPQASAHATQQATSRNGKLHAFDCYSSWNRDSGDQEKSCLENETRRAETNGGPAAGAGGGSATLVHVPERATIKLQPQDGGEGCRSQTSVNQGAGRGSVRSLAWGSRSQGRSPRESFSWIQRARAR
ncbi:hypothetical protein K491DRAFT_756067 [Lophiostoma macrostomum CBS 122681]|uniref:Uncharacterized protein n=1 Tax=Lophiostoma macrostomum CBS 122681 TaxID=1314788 RepID=A0A6A6TEZ9_9PLEO|nr:hypothetical protein K491DRAFT_756067 [Lophiostoma macrostomum CBS 122681]